jgi:hypothetical protein
MQARLKNSMDASLAILTSYTAQHVAYSFILQIHACASSYGIPIAGKETDETQQPISSPSFSPSWPFPSFCLASLTPASHFYTPQHTCRKTRPSPLLSLSSKSSTFHHRSLAQEEGMSLMFWCRRNRLFAVLTTVVPVYTKLGRLARGTRN